MISHFLCQRTFRSPQAILLCCVWLCVIHPNAIHSTAIANESTANRQFQDFLLPEAIEPGTSADTATVSLSADPAVKYHVICFLGTQCPLAKVYGPRLQRLSLEYASRGVTFVGINSNVQDTIEELVEYKQRHEITFPLAKDYDRSVALQAGASRTPEVFVVDRSGAIQYQGRIDNQYEPGITRSAADQHHLRQALDELLADKPVSEPSVAAVGCLISLPKTAPSADSPITYCDQVARVLQEHCIECHRSDEIGPFPLDVYEEVVGWAEMSLEVIDQGRMPPWHASPQHGSFSNARQMEEADKQILREWVIAGTPYGDAKKLPAAKQYSQGWRFGKEPDLVLPMSASAFPVPAEGTVDYQYFVVDPGFTEDKWIRAAQVIPGDSSVVHHCITFTRPPDDGDVRNFGLLAAYVPGQIRGNPPEGFAQRVPAGSRIVFQMHYTPNGKATEDLTRLGLVFADPATVTHEIIALGGVEQEFEIPPGAAEHAVHGRIGWFPQDGLLLSIMPHMHLRGKSYQFQVVSQGKSQTLLDVPVYDFNWQHNYEFTEPLPLADIDDLTFVSVFDNSANNPSNPDASEFVTWGDQTWQEMAVTFISVARPLAKQATKPKVTNQQDLVDQRQAWKQQADAFADRYIQRFDQNGDQVLTAYELPDSVRMFRFWSFDHDSDSRISRDEIADERFGRLERMQQ